METKKPYMSKTLIANFIVAGLAVAGFGDKLTPAEIALGLSGLNVLLRLVTKDKIGFGS